MTGDPVTTARKKATLNMTTYASQGSLKLKLSGIGPTRVGTRKFFIAMKNCVAMLGLVGPRAGRNIGTCVDPIVTEPIDVVQMMVKSATTTMTMIRSRFPSCSMHSNE